MQNNWSVTNAFLNFLLCSVDRKHLVRFQSENIVFKLPRSSVDGALSTDIFWPILGYNPFTPYYTAKVSLVTSRLHTLTVHDVQCSILYKAYAKNLTVDFRLLQVSILVILSRSYCFFSFWQPGNFRHLYHLQQSKTDTIEKINLRTVSQILLLFESWMRRQSVYYWRYFQIGR